MNQDEALKLSSFLNIGRSHFKSKLICYLQVEYNLQHCHDPVYLIKALYN